MSVHDFLEAISYALVEIRIRNNNFNLAMLFDIDHVEHDDDTIYLYGDHDEPFMLKKAGLNISKEKSEDVDVFILSYPDMNICINILT